MFTEEQIETIVSSQLHSLLWSEGEEYNDAGEFTGNFWNESYSEGDATPELRAKLTEELEQWEPSSTEVAAIRAYYVYFGPEWLYSFGHDLALTRNGHGAGFWDRGLGDAGYVLTDWTHTLGELHVFHGHDSIHPDKWAGMFHAE